MIDSQGSSPDLSPNKSPPNKLLSLNLLTDHQIDPSTTSIGTLASKMSPKHQEQGVTAYPTSQDLFLLTRPLVTNLEESTVILIHQLSNFGVSSHKFFKNLKDNKRRLIRAAAKNT